MSLKICPTCRRHVRSHESGCPFCGAALPRTTKVLRNIGFTAAGMIAAAACGGHVVDMENSEGSHDAATGKDANTDANKETGTGGVSPVYGAPDGAAGFSGTGGAGGTGGSGGEGGIDAAQGGAGGTAGSGGGTAGSGGKSKDGGWEGGKKDSGWGGQGGSGASGGTGGSGGYAGGDGGGAGASGAGYSSDSNGPSWFDLF